VRILLDENLPRKLVDALRAEGHHTESVHTLNQRGIDDRSLYALACRDYDICFTRDAGFIHNARQNTGPQHFKLLRVTVPQQPQEEFVKYFMAHFRVTDWERYKPGDDWP
jgi:predicted nuclease of predicted toxin-antitoxin system